MPDRAAPRVAVVGLVGGAVFGADARTALDAADVVVGSTRQLERADLAPGPMRLQLTGPLDDVFDRIAEHRDRHGRVCVLASGDPGFFGIVRALGERFGPAALRVYPAPSAIALAFARLGLSWDDAVVVSAHGRSLDAAIAVALPATKVAVLTSPDNPPEAVCAALLAAGCGPRRVAVVARIGEADEAVIEGDLAELAAGAFDPLSVVVLTPPGHASDRPTLAWGLPERCFDHRDGMITKAEVRAVALGKLALPTTGVLWDVGAGSGSVAVEAARLRAGLRVFAIESDAASANRIRENARAHDCSVDVVHGRAPEVLERLPAPDRVFVGGGGLEVLDAALVRLRPGGVVVANYALVDRAVAAWERLGNLVELAVSRGIGLGERGVRLAAENPVFVCWGPE
jgi:precorrin-6B C5,15-methyltransferase / cobalt-precorrin-6B C5,C15-methyltransferase